MSPNLPTGSYLLALIQLGPLPKKSRKIIVRGKGILKKKRGRNQRQVSPSNCVLGLPEAPLPPLVWFIAIRRYLLLFFQSSNNQGHAKCCMQVCAHTETDFALNLGWCLWLKRLFTYLLHWILKTYTSFGNWNSPVSLLLALYSPPHPNKQPHGQFPQNSKQTRKAGWTDGLQNPVLQILLLEDCTEKESEIDTWFSSPQT